MPRFSANLGFLFTDRPLIERFAAAAACGFSAVEAHFPYDIPPREVRAALAEHRLTMLGINTVRGNLAAGEFGLAALPGRESEFRAALEQAVDYQRAIGGNAVHCMAGTVAPGSLAPARETYAANIAYAADTARRHGLTVLIEPINQRDHPGYFLSSVEQAAALIADLGRPNVRVMFDFYHLQILQGDLLRRFETHQAVIGHVQVASVPARAEPDEGELNFPAIFAALDRLGYDGWIGAEYRPRGRTEDGLSWGRPYGLGLARG